jgi:hypothetical protein
MNSLLPAVWTRSERPLEGNVQPWKTIMTPPVLLIEFVKAIYMGIESVKEGIGGMFWFRTGDLVFGVLESTVVMVETDMLVGRTVKAWFLARPAEV